MQFLFADKNNDQIDLIVEFLENQTQSGHLLQDVKRKKL